MKFDTGAPPKGVGIVEVDKIIKRKNYTVGKYHIGQNDEVIYMLCKDGTVGIARKHFPPNYNPERAEKRLLEICSKF